MSRFLCLCLAWCLESCRLHPNRAYPQLWYWVSRFHRDRWPLLRHLIEWLCQHTIGHEWSATEWGYGGGQMMDRWCRWCGKRIEVPVLETDPPPSMVDMIERFNEEAAE